MHLYTSDLTLLDLLQGVWGGGIYRHLKTWVWRLGRKEDLLLIAEEVLPLWDPEKNPRLAELMALLLPPLESDLPVANEAKHDVDQEHGRQDELRPLTG